MKGIQNAILKMSVDLSGEEFSTLCLAVHEAHVSFPEFPQMKEVCADIRVRAHKASPGAVAKSLERAVNRIFEYGDWQALGTYQHAWLYERPLPNQFIRTVAMRLWDGKPSPSSEWVGWSGSDLWWAKKGGITCDAALENLIRCIQISFLGVISFEQNH